MPPPVALQGGFLLSSMIQLLLAFRSSTGRTKLVEMLCGTFSCMDVCGLLGCDEAIGY